MNIPRKRLVGISEATVEAGLLLLLVGSPAVFGSVERWAYRSIQVIGLVVLFAFIIQRFLTAGDKGGTARAGDRRRRPLYLFLAAFLLVAAFQLLPLPPWLLGLLNPSIYAYRFLGGESMDSSTLSLQPALTGEGLLKALSYFIVFLVLAEYHPWRRSRRAFNSRLAGAVVASGFLLSAIGIIQFYAPTDRIFGVYGINAPARFGLFINRNHFANYAAMVIALAAGVLISFIPRGKPDPFNPGARRMVKFDPRFVLMTFVMMVLLTALLLSASRGGAMAAGAGLIFLLLTARGRGLLAGRKVLSGLILLLAFLLPASTYFGYRTLTRKLPRIPEAVTGRGLIWRDAWNIFRAHPVFGTGLETFGFAHARVHSVFAERQLRFPPHRRKRAEHAENEYLQLLAETGVAGFGALAAAGAWYFYLFFSPSKGKTGRRRPAAARQGLVIGGAAGVVACLAHAGVDFVFRVPSNALTLAALAAISLGGTGRRGGEEPSRPLEERSESGTAKN